MTEEVVQLEHSGNLNGEVKLRDPLGGHMAQAMEDAEIGKGNIKMTTLVAKLVPHCIEKHPWKMQKVEECVPRLHYLDWMKLFKEVQARLQPLGADTSGESDPPSSETDSPPIPDSEESS